jgi:hypothetical protein
MVLSDDAQTLQAKDEDDGPDDAEPLSAVQLALRSQLAKGPALPQPAGDNGTAAVAAASHGHLHMPFFEKVDIGELIWWLTLMLDGCQISSRKAAG